MRNVALMCAALALSACAQSFLKGARISSRNLANDGPDFTLGECVETGTNAPAPADAFRTPVNGRRGGEYSLVEFQGGTGLFERVSGGSYVINNTWREADGTHYFTWVLATGWEFIIPDSGNGRRLIRRGGSVRAADGTGRPTNKPPVYECELIRRGGSPTGVTSAPPPPPMPVQPQPQPQAAAGTRAATAAPTPAPAPVDAKAPIQKGSAIVITLNNGTEVKGTLLSETSTGFLVKGSAGTRLMKFEDVADIKGASAPPPPAAAAPAPIAAPVQPVAPPQPVGPKTTRISLFSKDTENWTVKVGESSCSTPCTVQLVPGAYPVEATREGETVKGNVSVPDFASHIMIQRPGSNAVKVAGLVTVGVGVLTMLMGLIIDPAIHTTTDRFVEGNGYRTVRYSNFSVLYPAVWLPIGGGISLTGFFMWLGAALDKGKVRLQRGEPRRLSELLAPMPAGFTAGVER